MAEEKQTIHYYVEIVTTRDKSDETSPIKLIRMEHRFGGILATEFISFDVEMPKFDDGVIVSYGDYDKQNWDIHCTRKLLHLNVNARDFTQKTGINEFVRSFTEFEEKYPLDKYNIVFLSYDSAADIKLINKWLTDVRGKPTAHLVHTENLRPITGLMNMLDFLPPNVQEQIVSRIISESSTKSPISLYEAYLYYYNLIHKA